MDFPPKGRRIHQDISDAKGVVDSWQKAVGGNGEVMRYIAKGSGRTAPEDFVRFLTIARGSLYELSTQIEIAGRRSFSSMKLR